MHAPSLNEMRAPGGNSKGSQNHFFGSIRYGKPSNGNLGSARDRDTALAPAGQTVERECGRWMS